MTSISISKKEGSAMGNQTNSKMASRQDAEVQQSNQVNTKSHGPYRYFSFALNSLLGFLGLGVGFVFFLVSVVASGSAGLMALLFGGGAIVIGIYSYIVLKLNRFLVVRCSKGKNKKQDKKRFVCSLIYVACMFLGMFIFSFVRAGLMVKGIL